MRLLDIFRGHQQGTTPGRGGGEKGRREKGRKGEQEPARVWGTCHIRSFTPHREVEAALPRLHFTEERTEAERGAVTLGKCGSRTYGTDHRPGLHLNPPAQGP